MKSLVLLAGLIFIGCQNQTTSDTSGFKTIMIKSSGEVETLPDIASFQINLSCLNLSIETSKECLIEKTQELNEKLKSFGIDPEDILTTSVDLNASYTWRNNSRVFEGYRSSTTVFVTVKNIDKLDEIYTVLLANRNLDLGGLSYAHSKIDSLQNEAYVNALQKAGVLSEKLLSELPEDNKEILKIGNVEISSSMPEPRDARSSTDIQMEEASAGQNQSIAINKGTVRVTATLYVEYRIE